MGPLSLEEISDDGEDEAATLRNSSSAPVSMTGWKLRDAAGQIWALDSLGQIAWEEKTIRREGQPMALNNNGDTVRQFNPPGTEVHRVTYPDAEEGVEIAFPWLMVEELWAVRSGEPRANSWRGRERRFTRPPHATVSSI